LYECICCYLRFEKFIVKSQLIHDVYVSGLLG
jgi:hypothetical protein